MIKTTIRYVLKTSDNLKHDCIFEMQGEVDYFVAIQRLISSIAENSDVYQEMLSQISQDKQNIDCFPCATFHITSNNITYTYIIKKICVGSNTINIVLDEDGSISDVNNIPDGFKYKIIPND